MKNYSNPYQAPALNMLLTSIDPDTQEITELITSAYDNRIEPGFRALFAGMDGWYEIYKTKDGIIYKNKIGSGGSSGGGSGEGVSEAWVIDNFYNKTDIDGKIKQLSENVNTVNFQSRTFSLDPKFPGYYFNVNLFDGIDDISLKPSGYGEWFLYFLGSYYNYGTPYDMEVNILIDDSSHPINISNQTPTIYCFNYSGKGNYSFKNISPISEERIAGLEQQISLIPKFNTLVVSELPTENISDTTVYLVTGTGTGENNLYEEYIYVKDEDESEGGWELLGTQTSNIDLDNYYTKEEIDNKGYLIEIPSEYITQTELDDKDYAKTSDIPTKVSELENDAQYLDSFEQSIEDIAALSGFYYTFEANHVYKVKIDSLQEKVQFYFATPSNDEIVNQILIYLDNTTLGDSQPFLWSYENISPEFINGEEPTIGKARYRILAEYNPYSENWVVGVVPDGKVLE